jgi:outer membrane lipoprotein-sorting protein
MKKKFQILLIILIIISINFCETDSNIVNKPVSDDTKQLQNFKYNDPRSKPLVEIVERLEKNSTSFTGEFSMKILSGEKLKEANNVNGKIFFDKPSGKVKIQLMEPFFGLIISQIISDSTTIRIKSSGQEKLHTQDMGDIHMKDPTSHKPIVIPYPVIYFTIAQNFIEEFKSDKSYLSPSEKRVLVKRGKDEYKYFFYETGLASLEFLSSENKMRAICQVPEKYRSGDHPPQKLTTLVTDLNTDQDTSQVDISYKNVRRNVNIPPNTFNF